MLYKIFESSIKRLIFPQTAVKSGIPTESRNKNRKPLTLKDFRFSLLYFWRVFGEIRYSNLHFLVRHPSSYYNAQYDLLLQIFV